MVLKSTARCRVVKAAMSSVGAIGLIAACSFSPQAQDRGRRGASPVPPPDTPGVVVLFSGKPDELPANWYQRGSQDPPKWTVTDEVMTPAAGDIVSKQKFTDFQLHVEFKEPYMPDQHGQARGNSGIGLQSLYEIQVLDSYGIKEPGSGDCAAVYGQRAPLVNACRPPLQWQTYDIVFHATRWDDQGKMTDHARVTVLQNGIVVQNNQEILGTTGINDGLSESNQPGPLVLQFHGNPVQFRDVWVLPLPLEGAKHYEPR